MTYPNKCCKCGKAAPIRWQGTGWVGSLFSDELMCPDCQHPSRREEGEKMVRSLDADKPNTNENCLEGMRCPKCGSLGPFLIDMGATFEVDDTGLDGPEGDTEWDEHSACRCKECNFFGRAGHFYNDGKGDGENPNADSKWGIWIVWGTEDAHAARDNRWDVLENAACYYEYDTEAEFQAFMDGVEAAEGWLDHETLESEDLASYLRYQQDGTLDDEEDEEEESS